MDSSSITSGDKYSAPTPDITSILETPDPAISRRLVRKLDFIALPLLAIIYFTHSLDRANLGNAKTDGLEKDIGLKDNQYSLILILFYIPYGTLNIPATILSKRFSPAVIIPLLMFCWGAIATCTAAVHNFGGILAARICLGIVEAGFFPSAIFYLTLFYTRTEIAKRISLFYMMGFVANAFSGLIAYSVFQWHRRLYNWQYLFLIEGSLTVVLSIVSFILLPRSVEASKYFTADEKHCSTLRLRAESPPSPEGERHFSWKEALRPLLDWHSWMYGFMALCYGCAAASISNFLPTIVKSTFLLTFGSFTPAVLIPAWLSSNTISISGRATTLGLVFGLQNIAGIISSESFRSQDAPVYAPALIISGCFQGAMCVTAGFAYFYYRMINRKLDRGEIRCVRGMEQNPDFRYVL